ncbi:transporter substrate-binding domain-containing protein [Paucibacter sp. R3-3]|uniref:Transporter substrate-binding domain-containing protein n=1 Tax=Roseateles agri TaxID=3098619 RepID=A0ABU5DFJ7_9BURK|nr:transporter substrate-binding domain-containing protein [Paucibacter sp. R3-3]MDY0745056.1 transporter substrate-binding domain-containing protein [Paucibacter sp. R3-3]
MRRVLGAFPGALIAALLVLAASSGPATAAEEEVPLLRLVTTHFPPFEIEQGADAPGPLVRQASAVAAQAGFALQVEFVPWPRAQLLASSRQDPALILPLVRAPEREARYLWIGKLSCRYMGFVALRERMSRFDEETLAGTRMAVLRAAPYRADNMKTATVHEAISFEEVAKLLERGIVDLAYGNQETIALSLKARGIDHTQLAMSKPLESDPLWLAASLGTPTATVEALRQGVRVLQKDGTLDRMADHARLPRASCSTG